MILSVQKYDFQCNVHSISIVFENSKVQFSHVFESNCRGKPNFLCVVVFKLQVKNKKKYFFM